MLGILAALLGAGVNGSVLSPPMEDRRSSVYPHKSLEGGSQDCGRSKSAKSKILRQVFEKIFHNSA